MPFHRSVSYPVHSNSINAVAEVGHEGIMVTASTDRTLKKWSLDDAINIHTLHSWDAVVARDIAVFNNTSIFTITDREVYVFRVTDGCILAACDANNFTKHNLQCCGVINEHTGIIGDRRGNMYKIRWDQGKIQVVREKLRAHSKTSTIERRFVSGSTFATCSSDRTAKLWDVSTLDLKRTFKSQLRMVNCVTYNDLYLVTASNDKKLHVYDVRTANRLKSIHTHKGLVNCVCFVNNSNTIISGDSDKIIATHLLPSGECITKHPVDFVITSITIHHSGRVAVAGNSGVVKVFGICQLITPPPPEVQQSTTDNPQISREVRDDSATVAILTQANAALQLQLTSARRRIVELEESLKRFVEAEEEICCIDLEPFRPGDEVFRLPCMHVHHKQCVMPYLKRQRKPECPVCNTPVPTEDIDRLPVWNWQSLGAPNRI